MYAVFVKSCFLEYKKIAINYNVVSQILSNFAYCFNNEEGEL